MDSFPSIRVFLMTPINKEPREFSQAWYRTVEAGEGSHQAREGVAAPGGTFDFNDPIPSYKPLMAQPVPTIWPLYCRARLACHSGRPF
jgi:hypothetical protein